MRVWFIPIEELSDMHVLGQHRELHMLESMLVNPSFQGQPLVQLFSDKINYIRDYHDRLVVEIYHRFKRTPPERHGTPSRIIGSLPEELWEPPLEWVLYDYYALKLRYDEAPEGKYVWTNREVPKWVTDNTVSFTLPGITPSYRK